MKDAFDIGEEFSFPTNPNPNPNVDIESIKPELRKIFWGYSRSVPTDLKFDSLIRNIRTSVCNEAKRQASNSFSYIYPHPSLTAPIKIYIQRKENGYDLVIQNIKISQEIE